MAPHRDPLEPVALPGEYVRLEPAGVTKKVAYVEQMGRIGPVDYGPATAGSSPEEDSSSIIDLDDELEMNDNTLGQFIVCPLSLVEVEIRQTGQQDSRFKNKNQIGKITPYEGPSQRTIYTYGTQDIQFVITNPQSYDMQKTLVYYTGYKLVFEEGEYPNAQTAASVTVDSLHKTPQEAQP